MKNWLKNIVLALGISALTTTTANASSEYTWYKKVGNISVENGWVTSVNGSTTLELYVDVGTCTYGMGGYIELDYYANDGGYMENYEYYPTNGYRGWISVSAPATMSEVGTFYISDQTYCH